MVDCTICKQSVYVTEGGLCGECRIFEANDVALLIAYQDWVRGLVE